MKVEVQILGIGKRKKGNGKNGPYDFTDVSILYDDKHMAGQRGELITIDQAMLDEHPIKIGEVYTCEVYIYNFKTKIACFYG